MARTVRISLWPRYMTRTTAAVGAAVIASGMLIVGASTAHAEQWLHPLAEKCGLFRVSGVEDASTASCLRCHDGHFAARGSSHPMNMNYDEVAARRAQGMMPLRRAEDVVARGVFLPDGQIRCVTCHDGRSRWKYGLAIPPGVTPQPAVNPRDPSTYADPESTARRQAAVRSAEQYGNYGVSVSPRPLCLACHVFD